VPEKHFVRFCNLPEEAKADVSGYMEVLAKNSEYFLGEIKKLRAKQRL
jgi:hypothetical protein